MGGGAQAGADVCELAAGPTWGQGPDERELREDGYDQADTPVSLSGNADPGGC